MPNIAMSQVAQQGALPRLLVEKGIFTKEGFLEIMRVVNEDEEEKERKMIEGGL